MEIILNGGSLVWLRRDLRLEDNNAISKAISLNTKFILCFVFDKKILNPLLSEPFAVRDTNNFIIDNRISFIYYSLKELDKKLKEATTSVIFSPAQLEKKSKTIGKPLTVNKKQVVTDIINAIT